VNGKEQSAKSKAFLFNDRVLVSVDRPSLAICPRSLLKTPCSLLYALCQKGTRLLPSLRRARPSIAASSEECGLGTS